jgi:hypothetical protein
MIHSLPAGTDVMNRPWRPGGRAAGTDGLACISAGAGGHTGFVSPFAFIAALQAIRAVEPVAAVVARLAQEYQAAAERLSRKAQA